jgi:asparagine synthase (glutamine-hydrolysing)
LTYLWIPEEKTIFKNIYKLAAGSYGHIGEDLQLRTEAFYRLPSVNIRKGFQETVEELSEKIETSVEAHMVSDVPVSCFLSGGLDSSLIAAIAAKKTDYQMKTFTTTFREIDKKFEAMPDDQKYSKIVARRIGTDHYEIPLEPDLTQLLPKIMYHLDEPVADPATINTYLICKAARDMGVKVILSGIGADEILGGYRRHYAVLLAEKYKRFVPPSIRNQIISTAIRRLPVANSSRGYPYLRWAKRFNRFANLPTESAYRVSYSYYTKTELEALLHPDMHDYITYPFRIHEAEFTQFQQSDLVNQMCKTDIRLFLKSLNLTYTDRASMAASVEVRTPFVDKVITDYALKIPGRFKINGRQQKWVLKKAAEKWLPKEIVYRPKSSFGAPLRSWMRNDLNSMLRDVLSEKRIKREGFLNYRTVHTLISNDEKGFDDNAHRLWALLSLEIWLDQFCGN